MDKLPKKIYLQYHGDGQDDGSPVNSEDVTWSLYQEFENDIEYRLASHFTALESEVTRLKEENARLREAQRWIPVSEKLPDDGVFVVVIYNGNELPAIAFIQENQWRKYPNWWIDHVTHWMPLPKPPEAA